jgi:hypothetical protein
MAMATATVTIKGMATEMGMAMVTGTEMGTGTARNRTMARYCESSYVEFPIVVV